MKTKYEVFSETPNFYLSTKSESCGCLKDEKSGVEQCGCSIMETSLVENPATGLAFKILDEKVTALLEKAEQQFSFTPSIIEVDDRQDFSFGSKEKQEFSDITSQPIKMTKPYSPPTYGLVEENPQNYHTVQVGFEKIKIKK